jgi:hypothetical protein
MKLAIQLDRLFVNFAVASGAKLARGFAMASVKKLLVLGKVVCCLFFFSLPSLLAGSLSVSISEMQNVLYCAG